jgi:hypothetical protein
MRIIFIPGFGEDELIFSRIAPLIPGDKLILNSWTLLGDEPKPDINAFKFAKEVIERYNVSGSDIIIGHSMGGWIAYHIKHLIGCRIIQIASFTNRNRIRPPVIDHTSVYWSVKHGIVFNSFTLWITGLLHYYTAPSKEIYCYVTERLKNGNKENVNNQLRINYATVNEVITVAPDLRIHSPVDGIVKPPKESYYKVPGDHFTLYTHPAEVSAPIIDFLNNQKG